MSIKKKLGSKLTEGVRQVKSQREHVPAAPLAKTSPVAKPVAKQVAKQGDKPMLPSVAAQPVTPRAATQAETNLNTQHPQRVWPD